MGVRGFPSVVLAGVEAVEEHAEPPRGGDEVGDAEPPFERGEDAVVAGGVGEGEEGGDEEAEGDVGEGKDAEAERPLLVSVAD